MKKMMIPVFVCFLISVPALGQDRVHRDHDQMHRLHQNPDAYIAMLESSERDSYQKPAEVLQVLNLRQGEAIADVGAGSGYFTFRFSAHVGATGSVYAVDVNPAMIRHMNKKMRDFGLSNVRTVLAEPNDPLLRPGSIDSFFICNTWHHIGEQEQYLETIKKILKPGGRVVMIDFRKEDLPFGPPLEEKISRADLVLQMQQSGFKIAAEHTFLPHQYFLVFRVE